jgi:hypothetical protein
MLKVIDRLEVTMNIQPLIPILAAVAVVIAISLIVWISFRIVRSRRLKSKFGPEYDFAVNKMGDRRAAETNLKERIERVNNFEIHELDDQKVKHYHDEWIDIQAEFVDDPVQSIHKANQLITEVMIARGFPVADFTQRSADLSVLYPEFVPKYREANAIAMKNQDGGASTEELRQAILDYHSLFDELLGSLPLAEEKLEAVNG